MHDGGTVVTFELDGGKDKALQFLNTVQIAGIPNNLGVAKSFITHPATTAHQRLDEEERARLSISGGVIRLSVGLEDPSDLDSDIEQAIDA